MPALKLTKRNVDAIQPAQGSAPDFYYDPDLAGFGVRVTSTGSKSWVVEYRPHGGGRAVTKRRVTLGKVGALTPDQARRAAAEMLAQVRLGADPATEKTERRKSLTVGDLLALFDEQYVATMVKPGTAVSHRIALGELRRAHGGVKAEALSRAQVASLHARMADRPYAANRAAAVWGKVFTWGASRGLVPEGHNPTKGLQKYREQGRERFLTSDELARLGTALADGETVGLPYEVDEAKPNAKHAAKPENRRVMLDPFAVGAIRLLILTGARLREILDAKWSEVDMERGVIFLSDSKTGRKPIYLSAAAQEVLASLPRIEGNPHIIAGAKEGAPRADLKKPWAAVCRAAGLKGVRIHDLRHSFASFGAGASLGLPIIGKLLGHTQAATTARYAHLDADPLRRAVDTIGATIAAAMEGNKGGDVVPLRKSGGNK
ncbi:site-specific integrase [Methylocystis parvus]|uniref:Site-specific integrase n=1 Tax=Methylocystis parvus TaxID=134 RepID=A0A6B8M384_9HYPH|nr:site-specific integrase [Methylocystis parvus]QGM96259.1 site-specific integrase [Methylocystis parvus]WBJ99903.1 site-specific integrase [Methylocystis parvus OBBP]